MGFFESNSKKVATSYFTVGDKPGAIPVATPVPEIQQQYPYHQAMPQHEYHNSHPTQKSQPSVEATVVSTTVQTTRVDMREEKLERCPMMMKQCPHCRQESRTRITTYPNWQTWAASGVMLCVFWPICWVPLILDNCKKTDHYCVLCHAKVGNVEPFQDCCVTEQS